MTEPEGEKEPQEQVTVGKCFSKQRTECFYGLSVQAEDFTAAVCALSLDVCMSLNSLSFLSF